MVRVQSIFLGNRVGGMIVGSFLRCGAIALCGCIVVTGAANRAGAAITVTYHLGNAPSSAATNITSAVDAAVSVWNDWSSYNKAVNVYYNTGVPTAQANFDGVITFGAGTQYHTPAVAWHEMLHVMGSGTYGAYFNHMVGGVWTGRQGISMTQQYFPNNTLVGDNHVHWVGGGSAPPEQELSRQGVHILGAMRADMGISNGNRYDLFGDFNDDGTVDRDDYLILAGNLYTGGSRLTEVQSYIRGDMNGDRFVNDADVVAFHDVFDLLGDFNGNDAIGVEDYEILLENFRSDVSLLPRDETYLRGDVNLDRSINYVDFIAFRDSYHATNGAGSLARDLAVPEPAAIIMFAVGAICVVGGRRRVSRICIDILFRSFRPLGYITTCSQGSTLG